ncbi:DUF5134 domain-containing protein [Streptomyces sp. MN03-5084-2B]|nr:DUF5134 domain-containing protein [Streptomyces sp. MN03-5084-2B]
MPDWLRAAWGTGFVVITAVHLRHALGMSGRDRWWHGTHTVLAVGMGVMFLVPRAADHDLYETGAVIFTALALTSAGMTVFLQWFDGRAALPWAASTGDAAIMAAMCAVPQPWPAAADYGAALYLGAVAVAWVVGWWDRVAAPPGREDGTMRTATTTDLSTRTSLSAMAAGMAFMLVAMR